MCVISSSLSQLEMGDIEVQLVFTDWAGVMKEERYLLNLVNNNMFQENYDIDTHGI